MVTGHKDAKGDFHPHTKSSGGVSERDLHGGHKSGGIPINDKKLENKIQEIKRIHGEPLVGYIEDIDGKKKQSVTIDIELKKIKGKLKGVDGKEYENPYKFSISSNIWNGDKKENESDDAYIALKQAVDEGKFTPVNGITIAELKKLFEVYEQWNRNDTNAGTSKQQKIIDEHKNESKYQKYDQFYDRPVAILREHSLETDDGYRYGSGWLYKPLPESILEFIRQIREKLQFK